METLFGTDGIRGTANTEPMTATTALKVGMACGLLLDNRSQRHRVVIGKDTRLSGYMVEPALTAGLVAAGVDPILVGPMPTPAVAMLTRSLRADLGIMISASHNAYHDNGIKLFNTDGFKISDEMEQTIDKLVNHDIRQQMASPEHLGRALRLDDAQGRYIEFAKQTFPKGKTLDGIKVVIDCANGAAYKVAPTVLRELGAEIVPIGILPDGKNINNGCGSTDTKVMTETIVDTAADIGIALDGDADRIVVADQNGNLVGGDQIIGAIAAFWQTEGSLIGARIVATVMSNIGLERFLNNLNINLTRVRVGDRYVVDKMREIGCNLGGEQSGHIVMTDHSTTGDGLLAALQILAMLKESQEPASQICQPFVSRPQVLRNIKHNGVDPLESDLVKKAISNGEKKLADGGRLLVRKSGTEPLVRLMAEGDDETLLNSVLEDIADVIEDSVKR